MSITQPGTAQPSATALPDALSCSALQTAGLHDYAGEPEHYEPSTFWESRFELHINRVLMQHLAAPAAAGAATGTTGAHPLGNVPDLYLTLLPRNESPVELRCRQVRTGADEQGYSCFNTPPSEMLLLNPSNLRFTRAAIAGWTFSASDADADDSLFVEFGHCKPRR